MPSERARETRESFPGHLATTLFSSSCLTSAMAIPYETKKNCSAEKAEKIQRTKRAIKLIFKNNSLKDQETTKWKRDELRIFMSTAKKAITSSRKPYFVKIFDLYSQRLVNIFKFSSKDYGWKTINITDWRTVKPREDKRGRFGLKIVVFLAKKKLMINNTAFRESRAKNEPYFIEFFHEEDEKTEKTKPQGTGLFPSRRYDGYNSLPVSKYDRPKRDYYLPFQRYDIGNN